VEKGRSVLQNACSPSGYRGDPIGEKPEGTGFLRWQAFY